MRADSRPPAPQPDEPEIGDHVAWAREDFRSDEKPNPFAFSAGMKAARLWDSRNANPFDAGSEPGRHAEWLAGWQLVADVQRRSRRAAGADLLDLHTD